MNTEDPNASAPPLTVRQRDELLAYASLIALRRFDADEVERHATALEAFLTLYPGNTQREAMLRAMSRAHTNGSGSREGDPAAFLEAAQTLYRFITA